MPWPFRNICNHLKSFVWFDSARHASFDFADYYIFYYESAPFYALGGTNRVNDWGWDNCQNKRSNNRWENVATFWCDEPSRTEPHMNVRHTAITKGDNLTTYDLLNVLCSRKLNATINMTKLWNTPISFDCLVSWLVGCVLLCYSVCECLCFLFSSLFFSCIRLSAMSKVWSMLRAALATCRFGFWIHTNRTTTWCILTPT